MYGSRVLGDTRWLDTHSPCARNPMSHPPSQTPGDSNRWRYTLKAFVQNDAFGGILLLV